MARSRAWTSARGRDAARIAAAGGGRYHRAMSTATPAASWRQDLRTISLVSLAHGTSHFFHLLLPPLFPAFIRDFGLSWSELGLLVTVFFVISSIGQASAGFVVDRFGARPVLFAALAAFALAAVAAASAQGYGGLVLAAALAGFGNAPFHPVDFTILNQRVSAPRLGHAFSAHGISGNLGWAAAPLFMVGLAEAGGSWRVAYAGAALWALAVLALMWLHRDALGDEAAARAPARRDAGGGGEHPLAFLRLPTLWMCFAFFFCSTAALSAIQGFASPALGRMYGLPLAATAFVVTGFMLAGAAGMVLGGFVAARVQRLELTIAAAGTFAALLLLLVASGWLGGAAAVGVASLAGFGSGIAGPSRDMLIKRVVPPGATGRVYGTVYSGVDVGFAIGSPIFGWLLDHARPNSIFLGAAFALALGVAAASLVGWHTRAPAPRPVSP